MRKPEVHTHQSANLPGSILTNSEELNAIFRYHTVFGSIDTEQKTKSPNSTIRQTALDASSNRVFLEGNRSQVIAWTYESLQDIAPTILNQVYVYYLNYASMDPELHGYIAQ